MIRIAMAGALGRMGKSILSLAYEDAAFTIASGFEKSNVPGMGTDIGEALGKKPLGIVVSDDIEASLLNADVMIDFTHPSALETNLKAAIATQTAYVIGTTGLEKKHLVAIEEASKKIGIVQSPNMSVGVNLLFRLAELTSKALDEDYDIEITETHHRMKKDAPSGTALKLLEICSEARDKDLEKNTVYGRKGETGARARGEIGVVALRGGDVVGDHTVYYYALGERIELTHRASSRDAFAAGALKAAKFIANKKQGLFNMQQVLGLS